MRKICAIIVTYNRKLLLEKCIRALMAQKCSLDNVIIVNNASTDGTEEIILKLKSEFSNIIEINLEENIGGAGGFYEGIKFAYNNEFDYLWIMDDDTIANDDALFEIMKIKESVGEDFGFISSNVLYKEGESCIMNIPVLSPMWNRFLNKDIIELDSSSFVSILINRHVIKEIGLPIKEFFIWGDDVEYTQRISKKYKGYLATKSIVYHEMKENKEVNITFESQERINRYFFEFRNKYYLFKNKGKKLDYYKYIIKTLYNILFKAKDNKINRIFIVIKGYLKGIKFNPIVDKLN